MLKVGSEYLDFNTTVEVERKAKLFENLDSSDGDFSFQFDVPETSHNARLLNYPVPDSISKTVYHRVDCDLQDDSGVSLYTGFLRIERRVSRETIALSFFSGNSNWFGLISGNLMDMDMSAYDIEQTEGNIVSSWANTEGVTFPMIDHGGLLTRSFPQVKIEDLVGAFFVSTVFKKIFIDSQIKLTGELFEEPLYQKLVTVKNSKSQTEIDARTANVHTSLSLVNENISTKALWDDDSTYPYSDGSQNNFDLPNSKYVADLRMILKVESNLQLETLGSAISHFRIYVYVNGVQVAEGHAADEITSITVLVPVDAGDEVEIWSQYSGLAPSTLNITDGTVKFTPSFIYKTFGNAALPNWTKQQYVSSIFQIFNVITSFDPKTKTLTCNLFDKIKEKTPIDISGYVQVDDVDYTEFISSYGKQSTFSYNEVDFDEMKDYNIANFFKYGQGVINVDNDFLPEVESIIESEFSNPFSYINGVFDMSMERTNLIELDEGDSLENTSVTDASGNARFNIPEDIFLVGDLVRLTDFTNPDYNGDWVVSAIAAGWVEFVGTAFDTDAIGTLTKLDYTYANSDDVYLMVNIHTYPVANFSGNPFIFLELNSQASWGLAYFSLLNTNKQINIDYKQSLSFGEIQDPLFYQRTILETYWSLVSRILNDPVKPICTSVMPSNVYRSIDFLRPAIIKTLETSNLYYFNLLSGYKSSYEPWILELVKLP